MSKKRWTVLLTAAISVVAFAVTSTASAAQWQASSSTGIVDICFVPTGLSAAASSQAALSAQAWNVTDGLKVTYATCDTGAQKVPISNGSLTASGELGLTQWLQDSSGNFASAKITVDSVAVQNWVSDLSAQGDTTAQADAWRDVTCHEMGHALGLDHSTALDSCMQTNTETPTTTPGVNDVAALVSLYGGKSITSATSNIPAHKYHYGKHTSDVTKDNDAAALGGWQKYLRQHLVAGEAARRV